MDEIMEELVRLAQENGQLLSLIDALHRIVDDAETTKAANIIGGDIKPELIRNIFGWKMCDRARNALIEREAWYEAHKKGMRDERVDE